jgi:hypothetical protein
MTNPSTIRQCCDRSCRQGIRDIAERRARPPGLAGGGRLETINSDGIAPAGKGPVPKVWFGWLIGLIAAGALAADVLHFGDLERSTALTRRAQLLWLGAAVLLQCATYGAVALGWSLVLWRARHPLAFRRLVPVAAR